MHTKDGIIKMKIMSNKGAQVPSWKVEKFIGKYRISPYGEEFSMGPS